MIEKESLGKHSINSKTLKTYSYNSILNAANRTANFININHRLPSVVSINNDLINMNDFLYLSCKSLNSMVIYGHHSLKQ